MDEAFIKSKGQGAIRFEENGRKMIYNGVLCRQAEFPYNVVNPEYYYGYDDWEAEVKGNDART